MKLVIFGLSVSSSWGNGHATLWRGLCGALSRRGHQVVFFEHDVPYYANHRDLDRLPGGGELILYSSWSEMLPIAQRHLQDADVAMITSYCFDAIPATDAVLNSRAACRVFYDLDTPVTLDGWRNTGHVDYITPRGLRDFDLVLSYTGGRALTELQELLGARRVAPLYGSVDPTLHQPGTAADCYRSDMNYLGTFAADRIAALQTLFVGSATARPRSRFVIGGSQYEASFPWRPNIFYVAHVPPAAHPSFYCSARLTVNVTRRPMAEMGYCPSGRLFEAAACGVPVLSDSWEGLEQFFTPGEEILVAGATEEALDALDRSPIELARIGRAARERALAAHTADARAAELENILASASARPQTVGVA